MHVYSKAQARRDMNPHYGARAAMWLYSDRYAQSGLGSMGFWLSLSDHERKLCRQMAEDIRAARDMPPNAS